jgi:hypothetical protein
MPRLRMLAPMTRSEASGGLRPSSIKLMETVPKELASVINAAITHEREAWVDVVFVPLSGQLGQAYTPLTRARGATGQASIPGRAAPDLHDSLRRSDQAAGRTPEAAQAAINGATAAEQSGLAVAEAGEWFLVLPGEVVDPDDIKLVLDNLGSKKVWTR